MPESTVKGLGLITDPAKFPMLVETSLSRLGCKDFKYNKAYRQITAKDTERYPGRNNWTIDYDILIRFEPEPDGGLNFDVTVTDLRNEWSQPFCDKRLELILKTIGADSQIVPEETKPSTAYGSARWATDKDLRAAGYVTGAPESNRLLVAPYERREVIAITPEQTNFHALICGPTGAGKSSGFFIPNLLSRTETSAIVTEATAGFEPPELYMKTAGWRASKGHKIYFFNPSDMTSTRINPLDGVRKAPIHLQTSLADSLAELVILNTTPPGSHRADPIWDKAEKNLLTIFILHVTALDPALAHFGGIRKLLATPERILERDLANSPSGFAAREFDAFCGHSSENYRHGVFAGLMTRLNPWTSEQIVRLTSTTDLDAEELKDELFTFYFSVPSRKAGMKPIAALTLNYLLDLALDTTFTKPLTLVLDEFTNFGYIPGIDDALSIIRRREIPAMLGIQDYRQLENVYTREKAGLIITQVGTRVFFRPRDFKTAKEVSDGLGYQTILESKFTDRGSVQEKEFGRPLMTPSELMEIQPDQVLVLTPSTPPVLCNRFTYETFPVPPSKNPPVRTEHPILKEYGEFERKVSKPAKEEPEGQVRPEEPKKQVEPEEVKQEEPQSSEPEVETVQEKPKVAPQKEASTVDDDIYLP